MNENFLKATKTIDSDNPIVVGLCQRLCADYSSDIEKACRLFNFVRDEIRYETVSPMATEEDYIASVTIERGYGMCIQKAVLLAALLRAAGIPCRLGFADIRNHVLSAEMQQFLGGNLITHHGYVEVLLAGRWIKAVPAFDAAMCRRHGLRLVEFDGINDASLPATTLDGKPHIEYVRQIGTYDDVPFKQITEAFLAHFG